MGDKTQIFEQYLPVSLNKLTPQSDSQLPDLTPIPSRFGISFADLVLLAAQPQPLVKHEHRSEVYSPA